MMCVFLFVLFAFNVQAVDLELVKNAGFYVFLS